MEKMRLDGPVTPEELREFFKGFIPDDETDKKKKKQKKNRKSKQN